MKTTIPEQTERLIHPWRFRLGDTVYARGRSIDDTFVVIGGELWLSCPHLKLLDRDGLCWRIAQIECSSKPITFRKG